MTVRFFIFEDTYTGTRRRITRCPGMTGAHNTGFGFGPWTHRPVAAHTLVSARGVGVPNPDVRRQLGFGDVLSTSLGAESHELTIFSVLSYRPLPQLPGPHPPSRRGAQNGSEFLYKEESTASRKCASRCGRGARGARRLSSALNSTCTYVDIRKDAFSILLLYHFHKPVSPRPFACHRRFSLSLTFFRPGQGGAPSSAGVGCATASSSGRTGTGADHGKLRAAAH